MKADRNIRVDEPTGRTGNALVVVKTAAVNAGFQELGIKLGQGTSEPEAAPWQRCLCRRASRRRSSGDHDGYRRIK
jgi:hypothetical protein